jgi:hypothetical protein
MAEQDHRPVLFARISQRMNLLGSQEGYFTPRDLGKSNPVRRVARYP